MTISGHMLRMAAASENAAKFEFIGSSYVSGAGLQLTIPTHRSGDLIVLLQGRELSSNIPEAPDGWNLVASADNRNAFFSEYRRAVSVSTIFDHGGGINQITTGYMHSGVLVFRASGGIGEVSERSGSYTDTVSAVVFPRLDPVSPSSLILGVYWSGSLTSAPAAAFRTAGNMAWLTTEPVMSSAYPSTSVSISPSSYNISITLEIKAKE